MLSADETQVSEVRSQIPYSQRLLKECGYHFPMRWTEEREMRMGTPDCMSASLISITAEDAEVCPYIFRTGFLQLLLLLMDHSFPLLISLRNFVPLLQSFFLLYNCAFWLLNYVTIICVWCYMLSTKFIVHDASVCFVLCWILMDNNLKLNCTVNSCWWEMLTWLFLSHLKPFIISRIFLVFGHTDNTRA